MKRLKRLLIENIAWAKEKNHSDPDFFSTLAQGQSPKVLWLGCSDSRVPAETITNSDPGDLFVHRNIANLFTPQDESVVSVLEYAVQVLKVADIIVCGHSGCGGVRASLFPPADALPNVKRRIAPLCTLAECNRSELDAMQDEGKRVDRLAELNVLAQVEALRKHPIMRDADAPPRVHGWLFDLNDGRIKVLADGDSEAADIQLQAATVGQATSLPQVTLQDVSALTTRAGEPLADTADTADTAGAAAVMSRSA